MSTSTPRTRRGDRYHHGDLRRVLLAAAFQLLLERGPEALSLREVARRAGVSHTAPYHHFADKAALIAALVEAGFDELRQAMHPAGDPPGQNLERLARIGVAYVRFAVDHPATFRLLFRPELRASAAPVGPALPSAAGQAAYAILSDAIGACLASGEVAGDAEALTLALWCGVHGLATLLLDGPLRDHVGSAASEAEALARTVNAVLASGLLPRNHER